jgi:hypothetical protein
MHNDNTLNADDRSAPVLDQLNELSMITSDAQHDDRLSKRTCEAAQAKLVQIARASRASGLNTYCSISLHVLEQLWPMSRTGYVSFQITGQIRTWTALSIRHFEKPTSWPRIVALVDFLADRRWERPVASAHRQSLLTGLRQDWSPSIEEFDAHTGVFPAIMKGAA